MPNLDPERLNIITYPDPRLREPGKTLTEPDDLVRRVANRMLELMRAHDGVGLAAPQVGLSWRLFVCNPTGEPADAMVFINPKLTNLVGSMDSVEGCLSIPDVHVTLRRAKQVTIVAHDLEGRPVEATATELLSRIWQHECDHLDGRLIIDRMSEADKIATRKTLRQLEDDFKKRKPRSKAR